MPTGKGQRDATVQQVALGANLKSESRLPMWTSDSQKVSHLGTLGPARGISIGWRSASFSTCRTIRSVASFESVHIVLKLRHALSIAYSLIVRSQSLSLALASGEAMTFVLTLVIMRKQPERNEKLV